MPLLSANGLSQSFGPDDIFSGVSLSIPEGGKIGLVGPNGIGKTTLLLILAGLTKPAAGEIHVARRTQIGYLPQESAQAFGSRDHSVYREMLSVFDGVREQEKQLREMEAAMSGGDESDALFEQYGKALEAFEMAGGYDYEVRIRQTLDGLGFDENSSQLPLTHLSGGQKTRALLARLLLENPDLLILDEPTNHLDIEAVQWLEGALRNWQGAVLLVSHDRYFLDRVVGYIWEMGRDRLEQFRGNYSAYVQQRQERWDRRLAEFESFKAKMEKELEYIRKHIASQNTLQAKGRLKRATREVKAVLVGGLGALHGKSWAQTMDEISISSSDWGVADLAEGIKSLQRPSGRPPRLNLKLASTHRSGNVVLRTKDVVIGYPGTRLFEGDDIELWREECAALIGPNGAGKTTFLRTILQELEPLSGQIIRGASLQVGYFAQAHQSLDVEKQVLEEFLSRHPMLLSEARNYLAQYLFRGDDVYKLVGELSGGERGRLALAILALEGANFLLLDEPTNHLDIPAQEMLQEVLEKYPGTILLVSHDRYLIDRLASQIWSLDEGRLNVFKGGYQTYLNYEDDEPAAAEPVMAAPPPESRAGSNGAADLSKNARRQRQMALDALEGRVHRAEARLEQLSAEIQAATGAEDFDKIQSLGIEYAAAEADLEKLMAEWENFIRE